MQDEKQEKLEEKVDWPELPEEVKRMFTEDTGEDDPNVMKIPGGRRHIPLYLVKYALTGIAGRMAKEKQYTQ